MKIGLTGPSGSGKTTLANFIAEKFDLDFLPGSASLMHNEEAKEFLKTKYNYDPRGHRNVINLSNSNPEFGYDFQRLLLESRILKLKGNDNFVTDRTPIDNLAYFLMQCSHNQTESVCLEYINQAIKGMVESGLTDLFIIMPNDGWTEDNQSRVNNNFYQHMSFSVFVHVLNRYFLGPLSKAGIQHQIISVWDLEQRKNLIHNSIRGIKC